MKNTIIACILLFVLGFALARTLKHFKGGGCCGSGGTIRDKKALSEPKLGEKTLCIEGMHCENCEIRIENALNRIPDASAKVRFKKGTAVVSYSAELPDSLLKSVVEDLGYRVTEIR